MTSLNMNNLRRPRAVSRMVLWLSLVAAVASNAAEQEATVSAPDPRDPPVTIASPQENSVSTSLPRDPTATAAPGNRGEFSAQGSGVVRIEHEAKLRVPMEKTEAVWEWLQLRYADCSWLAQDGRDFKAALGDEDFTDIYFDTPDLKMLEEKSGIRHRSRVVHSGSASIKDGRQLLQIKLDHDDPTGLGRSEIKFTVSPQKITRKAKTVDDVHPMLGLVDKNELEQCKELFRAMKLDPYRMRPILTVHQNRRRVYLSDQWGAFATLTLDLCSTNSWGTDLRWTEIELELNEIRYTEAAEAGRQSMEQITRIIQSDLQQAFPDIIQDQTPKYNKALLAIEASSRLPLRRLIRMEVDYREVVNGIQIAVLAVVGLVIGGVMWLFRARWSNRSTGQASNAWHPSTVKRDIEKRAVEVRV